MCRFWGVADLFTEGNGLSWLSRGEGSCRPPAYNSASLQRRTPTEVHGGPWEGDEDLYLSETLLQSEQTHGRVGASDRRIDHSVGQSEKRRPESQVTWQCLREHAELEPWREAGANLTLPSSSKNTIAWIEGALTWGARCGQCHSRDLVWKGLPSLPGVLLMLAHFTDRKLWLRRQGYVCKVT